MKQELIEIINKLYDKKIIEKIRKDEIYTQCKGFIKIYLSYNNEPKTYQILKKNFEKIGYTVKQSGFNQMDIYYNNNEKIIESIFAEYH